MPSALSLPELISAAQAGEVGAFGEVVRRFQDMAVGFAYARLKERGRAEDVAQEAFVAAFQALEQLREPAAFPAWFRRILAKYVDRARRVNEPEMSSWESSLVVVASDAPAASDPLERLVALERAERVLADVLALPEALRTSVILFYAGGHTLEEIADFVEEPLGTVKRRLHDARNQLRASLSDAVRESLGAVRPSRSPDFVRHVSELLKLVAAGERPDVKALLAREPESIHATGPHPIWGGQAHPLQVAAELGNSELVAVLLDEGANPDVRPATYDWSPLQLAIQNGHAETAALLVERGAAVDLWSAAALANAPRARELLRRSPSSVSALGPNSATPLHFAASLEIAKVLLEAGADLLAEDGNRNLPHQVLVAHADRRAVGRYLLDASGAAANVFFMCADGDSVGLERALDESPALLETRSRAYDGAAPLSRGAAPLHVATLHGQLAVARLLLDRGAVVDSRTVDGQTALHLAAGAGHVALAELLLDRGADAAAVEAQHRATPLDWALFHHARLKGPESCLAVAELLKAQRRAATPRSAPE